MNKLQNYKPVSPLIQAILACHLEGDSKRIAIGTDADGDIVWTRYSCTRPMCNCPGSWELGSKELVTVEVWGTDL
jgi:hypothetical protein